MHPMQKTSPGQRPRRGRHQEQPAERTGPMRIAKALARAGLCSRREAERWIGEGRVSVNGEVLKTPARDVAPGDRILVDGSELPGLEPPRLWRYHKPRGLVTTHSDPQGRKTVFDNLPPHMPRVISIGRLDFNTEGLLLLTNDGALARHLELPATGWLRRYRVRAHGTITQEALDGLKGGIEIAGTRYGPIEATLDKVQGSNVWLSIGLREGKNREVRTVLDRLGLTVNRLIRVSFGPFQLLDLAPGATEPVRRRTLIDQLGPKVSAELALTDDEDAPGRAKWAKSKAAAKPPAKAPSKSLSKSPGRAPTKAATKAKAGS
jgi:23S rRNA pseudouridine2605 synthase